MKKEQQVSFRELMLPSLTDLLEADETLMCAVYGVLVQGSNLWSGYFGLTENDFLMALLEPQSRTIRWTSRVPLELRSVTVKRSLFPGMKLCRIEFREGNPCLLRIPGYAFGFGSQKEEAKAFVEYLKDKAP